MDSAVSLIFKGIDQISGTVDKIHGKLGTLGRTVDTLDRKVGALRGGFNRINAVLQGFGTGLGIAWFYGVERAIGRLARTIPDLIRKGEDWLGTVDGLQDAMGGTAQQVSVLAAQAQGLEVPIDAVGRAMAMFTKNIRPNETLLKNMGIATRTANGAARDTVSIFYDVQRVLASANPDIDKAAVLSKLFGRNWAEVADLLSASPATLDAWAQHARQAGLEVSDAALQARQDLIRTRLALGESVTGLGTTVFTAIAPALTGLVNAVSRTIEANLVAISGFITRTAGFIIGLISGLFGLNLQLSNFAAGARSATMPATNLADALDKGSKGADKNTSALERNIAALDKQLRALDRQEQLRDAGIDRQDIEAEIAALEAQLEDMKGKAVFTAGMSALEAELERQRYAQSIVDQQKEIQDAKDRLAEHDHDEQVRHRREELEDERRHLQEKLKLRRSAGNGGGGLRLPDVSWPKTSTPHFTGRADFLAKAERAMGEGGTSPFSSIAAGQQFAKSLLLKIDGVITSIGGLITTWSPVLTILGGISKTLLDTLGPQGFVALWLLKQFGLISPIVTMLSTLVTRGFGGGGGLPVPPGAPGAPGRPPPPGAPGQPSFAVPAIGAAGFWDNRMTGFGAAQRVLGSPKAVIDAPPKPGMSQYTSQYGFPIGPMPGRSAPAGPGDLGLSASSALAAIGAHAASERAESYLSKISTAVSPGGPFFQNIYDQSGSTRQNADNSADSLGRLDEMGAYNKRTADRLDAGLDTSIVNKPSLSPVTVLGQSLNSIITNTNPLTKFRFKNGMLSTTTKVGSPVPECFVAGTLVDTPSGPKAIDEIAVGDEVLAVDVRYGTTAPRAVTAVHHHRASVNQRLRVTLEDGRAIEVTIRHRFYEPITETFIPIGGFRPGDALSEHWAYSVRGRVVRIKSIEQLGAAPTDVFNITVDVDHNYLVAGGILVHNIKPTNATGLLGLAQSPFNVGVMGEAGDEAVAIVRNPRPIGGAMSAGEFGRGFDRGGGPMAVSIPLAINSKKVAEALVPDIMAIINRRYISTDTRFN